MCILNLLFLFVVINNLSRDLGLVRDNNGRIELTESGRLLQKGRESRDRADYWLGIQLIPWLESSQRFLSPPSHQSGSIHSFI